MCHQGNKDTARQCRRCDYEFGQHIETTRGMLVQQLRRARIKFWAMLALTIAALGGVVALAIMHGVVIIGGVLILPLWLTVSARQTISISKHSLASLARQQPQLPKATLVEK